MISVADPEVSASSDSVYEVHGEFVNSKHEKEIIEVIDQMADDDSTTAVAYTRFSRKDIVAIIPGEPDDFDMPASTLRMWVLAFVFGTLFAGVDSFFGMRYPSVTISDLVAINGLVPVWSTMV